MISNHTELDVPDTDDKVSLLSYDEVIRAVYGFSSIPGVDDALRRLGGTDYAKSQGLNVSDVNDSFKGNSNWLLRTAGKEQEMVCVVSRSGVSADTGGTETYRQTVGVRPAMCLADVKDSGTPPANEIGTLAVTGVPKPIVGTAAQTSGLQVSEGFTISSVAVQAYDGGKWTGSGGIFKGGVRYRLSLIFYHIQRHQPTPFWEIAGAFVFLDAFLQRALVHPKMKLLKYSFKTGLNRFFVQKPKQSRFI